MLRGELANENLYQVSGMRLQLLELQDVKESSLLTMPVLDLCDKLANKSFYQISAIKLQLSEL